MRNTFHGTASFIVCVIAVLILLSLSGCTSIANFGATQSRDAQNENKQPALLGSLLLGNAELYTSQLAQELFTNFSADRQYRYAVAGFVPVMSMEYESEQQGPLMLLGHQLEQGLITEVVRRGFIAQDYKVSNAIIMSNDSERVLSRDVSQLSNSQSVDYYITGTITEQEGGAMVNARVIDVKNKDVIAAATKFFPSGLFWQNEQMTTRNGMLYRTSKPASTRIHSGE